MSVCKCLTCIALLFLVVAYSKAERTPCSHDITQAEFGNCLLRQARRYHPDLKQTDLDLKPLDPLPLGDFDIQNRDFIISNKNTVMRGLGPAKIVDVGWDFKQNTSYTIIHANVTLTSEYETSGSIMFVPMVSSGKLTVNAYNAEVLITYDFRRKLDERGVEYLETYNFKTSQHYELIRFSLKTGNQILDSIINAVLNYYWKSLSTVGPAKVAETIAKKLGYSVNKIFSLIPCDELFNYV